MPLFNVFTPPRKTQALDTSYIISLNDAARFYFFHHLHKPYRKPVSAWVFNLFQKPESVVNASQMLGTNVLRLCICATFAICLTRKITV